jgi:hypothetical protein
MQILPLSPGLPEYRFSTEIGDDSYVFDVRWNRRDQCWYLDLFEADGETAIFHGVKVVLGANLGRMHRHPLLGRGAFVAVDTSGRSVDATFDDLGTRVLVIYMPSIEIVAMARDVESEE